MSIIYEPEFFNSVKNQVNKDNIDEKIKDLIKKLTEEYNCFKNLKEYEKKNNFYKHNKKKIYPKISKPKTDDKIVLSYLNKITFDNYEILSKKIISNIRDNNFKMIIDKLLIISFKQYNYSKLYLDLYKAILDDDEKKNYLNNKICEIIINKNGDLNVLINNENINKLNYDDFCDNNKEKKNLKGKINIIINSESTPKTITIQDTGIGMSREQMIENLGTIARSGSKAFLKENQGGAGDVDIIGRFGVGFYAAFMVASKISVTSKSADASVMGPAHVWTSEGLGSYDISESTAVVDVEDNDAAGTMRGTKIVLELREENDEFANDARLLQILKMYSNFVPFPIELSGERVNTVQAIWASTPSDVSEDQYNEFYRYVTNAFDDPMYKLHFRADVPLDLKALFYVSVLDNIVFQNLFVCCW